MVTPEARKYRSAEDKRSAEITSLYLQHTLQKPLQVDTASLSNIKSHSPILYFVGTSITLTSRKPDIEMQTLYSLKD